MAGIDSCLSNPAFSKGLTDGISDCEQWVLSNPGRLKDKPHKCGHYEHRAGSLIGLRGSARMSSMRLG